MRLCYHGMQQMERKDIAEYRKVRPLGTGGMADVFEVEAPDGRRFAMKVFRAEKSRRFLEERFIAEARLLSTLYHPNVVRVHDWGVDDGEGHPWYVMDLVLDANGCVSTLENVRCRSTASEELAMRWFREIYDALEYLHECGVVHRDVKLENILIDKDGRARLADFGVSRIIDCGLKDEVGVATTFVTGETKEIRPVMGTYFYLPPEVRSGAAAGPSADFYALGVAFFRLLTGIWYEPGSKALDLLSPFTGFWIEALSRLLSAVPKKRVITSTALSAKRRRWRWIFALSTLGVAAIAAGMIAVVVARRATSAGSDAPVASVMNGRRPKPPPGVLWIETPADLRGVDIGTVTSVVVKSAMRSVFANQFNSWPSVRNVVVEEGVEHIEGTAFFGCGHLETVTLPDSLKSIGKYAFGDCSSLREVRCGKGLIDVGQAAFGGCTNLVDFHFGGDAPSALGTRIFVRTPTNLVLHVKANANANGWGETWPPYDSAARGVRREP